MSSSSVGQAFVQPSVVVAAVGAPHEAVRDFARAQSPGGAHLVERDPGATLVVFPAAGAARAVNFVVRLATVAARAQTGTAFALVKGDVVRMEAASSAPTFLGATLERALAVAGAAAALDVHLDEDVVPLAWGAAAPSALDPVGTVALADGSVAVRALRWELHVPLPDTEAPAPSAPSVNASGSAPAPRNGVRARERRAPRPDDAPADAAPEAGAARREGRPEGERASAWVRGNILRLGPRFGFIEDRGGQLYYFQSRNLAVDTPLKRGLRVVFRVLPPSRNATEKRAEDIFVLDTAVEGVLERVHPKGWGLLRVDCDNGLEHRMYVPNVRPLGFTPGQRIRCRLGANELGPLGLDAQPAPAPTPADREQPVGVTG